MVAFVQPERIEVDALIFGGGICALWTLARLRREGYSALALEASALGNGQTVASQGIIHGGVKYALGGLIGDASRAISRMPEIWSACLAGRGEIDLSSARVLSDACYLWTTPRIGARLAGVAASRAIRAAPRRVAPQDRPPALRDAPRSVDVYRVGEPVLDVPSVLHAIADRHQSALMRVRFPDGVRLRRSADGIDHATIRDADREVEIHARRYLFCAGAGNADYLARLGSAVASFVRMQRRPLHMVAMIGDLPMLYGHAIGPSTTPLLTITSTRNAAGATIWWIGGGLAEEGVHRDGSEQAEAARLQVATLMPWVQTEDTVVRTVRVDRAEGAQAGGVRPNGPVVQRVGNAVFCWPTKLALAPQAASMLIKEMPETPAHAQPMIAWERPPVARPPWEQD